MNPYLRKKLNDRLNDVKKNLDIQANEVIDDLAKKIGRLTAIRSRNEGMTFEGENCGVVIATLENALSQFMAEIEYSKKQQFATFAENRMYCEGTTNLLGLLTQYHYLQTEQAVIMAMPDAHVFRNDKASFQPEDLTDSTYDDTRIVFIVIAFKDGFVVFNFEEKIKS